MSNNYKANVFSMKLINNKNKKNTSTVTVKSHANKVYKHVAGEEKKKKHLFKSKDSEKNIESEQTLPAKALTDLTASTPAQEDIIIEVESNNRWSLAKITGITLTTIILLGIAGFIGFKAVQIYLFNATDSVTFEKKNFQNKNLRLYINEDPQSYKFGQEKTIDGITTPEILSSTINLIWKPKEYPLGKDVTLSAEFQDTGDWDITTVCNNCDPKLKYNWKPFYRGILAQYNNEKKIGNTYIYTKDKVNTQQDATTVEDWVSKNFQHYPSVQILDNSYSVSKFVNQYINYTDGSSTTIEKTLRGPHSFYVYLKDKFELSLLKQDLNWYENSDEVTVTLYDLDGNVVYQGKIDDDGNTSNNSIVGNVEKTFSFPVIPYAGVYRMVLSGNNDWTVKKLTINTNKIVIDKTVLSLDPADIYTEVKTEKKIKFFVWQPGGLQTVKITSETTNVDVVIDETLMGKDYYQTLKPESYTFATKGNQSISGNFFAFSKDNYFTPFSIDTTITAQDQADIVLSNLNISKGSTWNTATYQIDKKDLARLDNLNEIPFLLRNSKLDARYAKEKTLQDEGYTLSATYNDYKLWSKDGKKIEVKDSSTLVDFIKKNLPVNSSIYIESPETVQQNDFINNDTPEGFKNDAMTELNFDLRGSHSFYVYQQGDLNFSVTKQDLNMYDGADVVDMTLTDTDGKILCEGSIGDDGVVDTSKKPLPQTQTFQCKNLIKGIYILNLKERVGEGQTAKSDFTFKQIKLNTNKVMVKDSLLTLSPVSLYSSGTSGQELLLYFWHEGAEQTIYIKDKDKKVNEVILSKDDLNINKKSILSDGLNEIAVSKGDIKLSGISLSFNSDNLFNIYSHIYLSTSKRPSFIIINQSISSSYISSFAIEVIK
ncbi:MAG: hypothetical protein WCJ19_05655 [bacterium]